MDQSSLVSQQIDDGQRLVEQLIADGQPVESAFWAKTSDDENWFLYIVTELVDQIGSLKAYRCVDRVLRRTGPGWVSLSEVKVLSPTDPMAKDVLAIIVRYPSPLPTKLGSRTLGRVGVDEAYLYPKTIASGSPSTAG